MSKAISAYYNEFDPKAAAWLRQLIKNGNITPGEVDERSITEVTTDDLVGFDRVHFFAGIGTWDYCLNESGWGDRPVWTASLPCQPFSAAGKGLGKEDERHLLPHFLNLVRECKPSTIIGEQVAAAIGHGWLDDLYAEMEALGYEVAANVIPACVIGAPHIRSRLWWVATRTSVGIRNDSARENEPIFKKEFVNSIQSDLFNEVEGSNDTIGFEIDENISIGAPHIRQRLYWVADHSSERHQEQPGVERFSRKTNGDESWEDFAGGGRVGISDSPGSQQRIETAERARHWHSIESAGADDIQWIYCRDNKYRPIKPSIQPLVDGTARGMVHSSDTSAPINANATQEARAMRIKGYGNAIQAQVAIAFINAFLDAIGVYK